MSQGWRSSRSEIAVPDSRTSGAIGQSAQSPRRQTTQKISASRARRELYQDRRAAEAQHKAPATHMFRRGRDCRDAIWIPWFPPEVQCRFVRTASDMCVAKSDVRFTPDSDRESGLLHKVMSALPRKRTCAVRLGMSAWANSGLTAVHSITSSTLANREDGKVSPSDLALLMAGLDYPAGFWSPLFSHHFFY